MSLSTLFLIEKLQDYTKFDYEYEPILFENNELCKQFTIPFYKNNNTIIPYILEESSLDHSNTKWVHAIVSLISNFKKDYFNIFMQMLCHDNYLVIHKQLWSNHDRLFSNLQAEIRMTVLCECSRDILQMQDRPGLKYFIINKVHKIIPIWDIALIVYSYYERESYKQIITELLFRNCFPNHIARNKYNNSNLMICNIIYEYSKPFTSKEMKLLEKNFVNL